MAAGVLANLLAKLAPICLLSYQRAMSRRQTAAQNSNNRSDIRGLSALLVKLGIDGSALLGYGGESWVFALDADRIARVNRCGTSRIQVANRSALLSELARSAQKVSFSIPLPLETELIEGYIVTIEPRLPGRPLIQLLAETTAATRASLIRAYLNAAAQIGELTIDRPWYGDLMDSNAIRTTSFRAYLEQRARRSLTTAVRDFQAVNPALLAAALPEPEKPAFVHLDVFPGNVLADGETITAVLDFGASSLIGDRRLDPLAAAVYLTPAITPTATDLDRALAQEWLAANGLANLYAALQQWIAAYWSFAVNDISLHQWCLSILLNR